MHIISACSSEYLCGRDQEFVQLCRYLFLYVRLLLCYFYCRCVVLVVLLAVVVVFLSSKRTLNFNMHCFNLNLSHITSKFHIDSMFVTAELTTIFRIHYMQVQLQCLSIPQFMGSVSYLH